MPDECKAETVGLPIVAEKRVPPGYLGDRSGIFDLDCGCFQRFLDPGSPGFWYMQEQRLRLDEMKRHVGPFP